MKKNSRKDKTRKRMTQYLSESAILKEIYENSGGYPDLTEKELEMIEKLYDGTLEKTCGETQEILIETIKTCHMYEFDKYLEVLDLYRKDYTEYLIFNKDIQHDLFNRYNDYGTYYRFCKKHGKHYGKLKEEIYNNPDIVREIKDLKSEVMDYFNSEHQNEVFNYLFEGTVCDVQYFYYTIPIIEKGMEMCRKNNMDIARNAELINNILKSKMPKRYERLKCAVEKGFIFDENSILYAAENGDIKCLKYLCERGAECNDDEEMCNNIGSGGSIECLEYMLLSNINFEISGECMMMSAIEEGHLEMLKYLHNNDYLRYGDMAFVAAEKGHIECLRFLIESGYSCGEDVCAIAAENGQLECLILLYEKGIKWDRQTCKMAAKNKHFECLEFAYKNGCEW